MASLDEKIQIRYAQASQTDCTLSCGSNLEHLHLQAGERVLDLGCGAGHETLQAAVMVGNQGQAVGLDLTREMLTIAGKNAEEQNITNIYFVNSSIENLPFANNSFDVITSNCVINHAPDKACVYREIFRVLKNGGRFVVSDAVSQETLPEQISNDSDQWAACFGGAITEEEYLQSIKEAGFADINILSRREYIKNGYPFASLTIKAIKIQ